MTASLEAVGAVEVVVEYEFEAEVEAVFGALALALRGAAWEQTRLTQVLGGCLQDEAWEGGL